MAKKSQNPLFPYFLQIMKAHFNGLKKIGYLKSTEAKKLITRIKQLKDTQNEPFQTIKTHIEKRYKKLGPIAFTGISHEDFEITALRLFQIDQLKIIKKECRKTARKFLDFAQKHKNIPLPGYSDSKEVALSSIGHYFCSYSESLLDDYEYLTNIENLFQKSPLGSNQGFGISMLIDREDSSKELGFKNLHLNTLYAVSSAGKQESIFIEGLQQIMFSLGKFTNDFEKFRDFFKIKKNLKDIELIRPRQTILISHKLTIQNTVNSLSSGYHCDFSNLTKPVIESMKMTLQSLDIIKKYLNGIEPKPNIIDIQLNKNIYTAELASEIATTKKITLKLAMKRAHKMLKKQKNDPKKSLESKLSLGAPGNLDLHHLKNRLKN